MIFGDGDDFGKMLKFQQKPAYFMILWTNFDF